MKPPQNPPRTGLSSPQSKCQIGDLKPGGVTPLSKIFPQHHGTLPGGPLDPPPRFQCGTAAGSSLNCQCAWSCQGEVLRLQAGWGMGWYPSISSRTFFTLSHLSWLFYFFTQGWFQHLGIIPTLRLMDEEGVSLPGPPFAPASTWPTFFLPSSVTVNPPALMRPKRMHPDWLRRLAPL